MLCHGCTCLSPWNLIHVSKRGPWLLSCISIFNVILFSNFVHCYCDILYAMWPIQYIYNQNWRYWWLDTLAPGFSSTTMLWTHPSVSRCLGAKGPIGNKWALMEVMTWPWTGDKLLPGPMMTNHTVTFMCYQASMATDYSNHALGLL